MADLFTAASKLIRGGSVGTDGPAAAGAAGAAVAGAANVAGGGMDVEGCSGWGSAWGDGELLAGPEAVGKLVGGTDTTAAAGAGGG